MARTTPLFWRQCHSAGAPRIARLSSAIWPAREPAILIVDQLDAITAFRAMEVARAAMGLDQDARYTIQLDGTPSLTATREYRKARSGPPAT